MEYYLRILILGGSNCLNPYYNGRYSWRGKAWKLNPGMREGLNPYYNGRYSWRKRKIIKGREH